MAKKKQAQVEAPATPATEVVAAPTVETNTAQAVPGTLGAAAEQPKAKRGKKATAQPATPAPAPAAPAKPKVPGVALLDTRPYIAGQIILRHGIAAGVTDAMVAELDSLYAGGRKPNPVQSKFDLQSAFHAIRGYTGWQPDAAK